jgi:hypothetical protein
MTMTSRLPIKMLEMLAAQSVFATHKTQKVEHSPAGLNIVLLYYRNVLEYSYHTSSKPFGSCWLKLAYVIVTTTRTSMK